MLSSKSTYRDDGFVSQTVEVAVPRRHWWGKRYTKPQKVRMQVKFTDADLCSFVSISGERGTCNRTGGWRLLDPLEGIKGFTLCGHMRGRFREEGRTRRMKVHRKRYALNIKTFATSKVRAIEFSIEGDSLWYTSGGQLCVKMPVQFMTGWADVLVPVTDPNVSIDHATLWAFRQAAHN